MVVEDTSHFSSFRFELMGEYLDFRTRQLLSELADESNDELLAALCEGPRDIPQLAELFTRPQAKISQQLNLLGALNLVVAKPTRTGKPGAPKKTWRINNQEHLHHLRALLQEWQRASLQANFKEGKNESESA